MSYLVVESCIQAVQFVLGFPSLVGLPLLHLWKSLVDPTDENVGHWGFFLKVALNTANSSLKPDSFASDLSCLNTWVVALQWTCTEKWTTSEHNLLFGSLDHLHPGNSSPEQPRTCTGTITIWLVVAFFFFFSTGFMQEIHILQVCLWLQDLQASVAAPRCRLPVLLCRAPAVVGPRSAAPGAPPAVWTDGWTLAGFSLMPPATKGKKSVSCYYY